MICAEDDDRPFFRRAGTQYQWGYKYLILAKDAEFIEGNEIKMNKATILKEYEETIQKVSELSMLLANFDSNTEFSRKSYEFLWLLKENFCQNMKILETIAEMGKNIKIDYTPEVIDLVYDSTKLTEEEKEQTLNKIVAAVTTGRMFSESNYLYLKSKLTEKFETLENKK